MVQLNKSDGWGFVAAVAVTAGPLVALSLFGDALSKDPVGPTVCLLPGAVGLAAAVLASAAAIGVGRRRTDRFWLHATFGLFATATILLVGLCVIAAGPWD